MVWGRGSRLRSEGLQRSVHRLLSRWLHRASRIWAPARAAAPEGKGARVSADRTFPPPARLAASSPLSALWDSETPACPPPQDQGTEPRRGFRGHGWRSAARTALASPTRSTCSSALARTHGCPSCFLLTSPPLDGNATWGPAGKALATETMQQAQGAALLCATSLAPALQI